MRYARFSFKKLTLLKASGYLFAFALCAKGVALYADRHPPRAELIAVSGTVKKLRLGGDGRSTRFQIITGDIIFKCSSYYGKVWPGMERIAPGDMVDLLLERDRLNRDELITGKHYYIWELVHQGTVVVAYEDIHSMVREKEATINRYINAWLAASALLLAFAYLRQRLRS